MTTTPASPRDVSLWIGGSSGLARTYLNEFAASNPNKQRQQQRQQQQHPWICLGKEDPSSLPISLTQPPGANTTYVMCDLTHFSGDMAQERARDFVQRTFPTQQCFIRSVVVGLRPPLVTFRTNATALRYNQRLVQGVRVLLTELLAVHRATIELVVHISSIAAVGHCQKQSLRSIREEHIADDPPSSQLTHQPYDYFKRACEEVVEDVCTTANQDGRNGRSTTLPQTSPETPMVRHTSLRLGAIFSDHAACLQCRALSLQLYTGPYLHTKIDANSSWNVAQLLHALLMSQQGCSSSKATTTTTRNTNTPRTSLRPVYYYTRCTQEPVPYGEYLTAYRQAYERPFSNHDGRWPNLVSQGVIEWFVVHPLHFVTLFLSRVFSWFGVGGVPVLDSVDYLLQVTLQEHTFDMTETLEDFPEIAQESIRQCFRRRREALTATAEPSCKQKIA